MIVFLRVMIDVRGIVIEIGFMVCHGQEHSIPFMLAIVFSFIRWFCPSNFVFLLPNDICDELSGTFCRAGC